MYKINTVTLIALGLFVTTSDAKVSLKNISAPPIIIAKTIKHTLSLSPLNNVMSNDNNQKTIQKTITEPGSEFIKVHFNRFNIPLGAYVTVASADGKEIYRYDGINNKNATFNGQIGENGINQFSAMSVFGDVAVVTLHLPEGVHWTQSHQIEVDRFNAGQNEAIPLNINPSDIDPTSSCGVNERVDAVCWASSNPVEFERTRPVARLLMAGSGLCTGWRVGAENHMFTNNHCLSTQSKLADTEIWFNYQKTTCGGSTFSGTVKVTGKDLLKTDYDLDYSVFSVNDFASIASFGQYGLDVRTPTQGETIYIPQHGAGNPKELSIESDQNTNGLCQIDIAIANGRATDSDTGYFCDTIGGSSGSPVLASSSNNVIALHHFGGCENQGVRIDKIWPQVASIFNNQVPVGDNASGGSNQAPVAEITSNCNGLSCSFSAENSSDVDGSIINYQWQFGDGNTASGSLNQHAYIQGGTYSVSLTVTDDDNTTNTQKIDVSVSDNNSNELSSGVVLTNIAGNKDQELIYYINTLENDTKVNVVTSGGTGDLDLYVKSGQIPTKNNYDCRPYENGNNETCDVLLGTPGTVYIKLIGYSAFSNTTLVATNSTSPSSEFPINNLTASKNQWLYFDYIMPAGSTQATISTSSGSGDADLYVKNGTLPSDTSYDCRPYQSGNNESCTLSANAGDVLKIGIKAYTSFSGVTLNAQ
ncbi:hypothetical protein CJF42_05875 [Pseudoalteromonas sp. NBT06-2]|uniref:PKD domain-containing protein n=1 Tax=Pseudoalteromonas sp. NBT06-2 TaxID=2025950 RepID=UPI000BA66590|nr:PKD domain-containing protein [Pseudoalteromonas sp. NBT06-2]PAJ75288.1 hypothetical protein CJF42_05875 [Pseudoalteromonas sp. NBT06-2]